MTDWIDSSDREPLGSSTIIVKIDDQEHIAHWNQEYTQYEVGANAMCYYCGGYNFVKFEKDCYMYATHWKYLKGPENEELNYPPAKKVYPLK